MKLHRDLTVTQKTAWLMLHRLREAWGESESLPPFSGPIEADERHIGGKRKNKSNAERKAATGRGAVDMEAVVGVKDRGTNKVAARHVAATDIPHVAGFVAEKAKTGAKGYTDEAAVYNAVDPWFGPRASTAPPVSTSAATPTPTGSSRCGPCSSGATTAPTTG